MRQQSYDVRLTKAIVRVKKQTNLKRASQDDMFRRNTIKTETAQKCGQMICEVLAPLTAYEKFLKQIRGSK